MKCKHDRCILTKKKEKEKEEEKGLFARRKIIIRGDCR